MIIKQLKRQKSDFQQAVDEQQLATQLKRELSDETIIDVIELDSGLFNNTYRVNTQKNAYILKVAPEPSANIFYNERLLMQREKTLAKQLNAISPLIPSYLAFFTLDGRDAFLQPFIQGKLWHDVEATLTDKESCQLWTQLGAFTKTLHSHSGEQFGYPSPLESFSCWSEFIHNNAQGIANDCQRFGVFCEEIKIYLQLLPHFFSLLDEVKTPKLLHGDLWPRNIIIDGKNETIHIKAVIDAERAFLGDPISDWVLILYNVPDAFWCGYGENLQQTADQTRIAIYKGMYFILNILETVRFRASITPYRKNLDAVNKVLKNTLQ